MTAQPIFPLSDDADAINTNQIAHGVEPHLTAGLLLRLLCCQRKTHDEAVRRGVRSAGNGQRALHR